MRPAELQRRLQEIGRLPDMQVPVTETLLLLGMLDRLDADLGVYQAHLAELHVALNREIEQNPAMHENTHWQLARLNAVLHQQFGYHGDALHSGFIDPAQINFLDVIETRSGIPVAIGALYLELAQQQGWQMSGLNFPGHFLLRLEQGGERLIIDPFHGGKELNAGALRQLLKAANGPEAELSHDYYDAVTPRDVVLRFCNNRKTRFIEQAHYEQAMQVVIRELWLAPHEPRLYFDAGVIAAKLEQISQAMNYLQKFVEISPDKKTVSQARTMLNVFRLNLQ